MIGLCMSTEVGKVCHHLSQGVAYLTAGYTLTFGEQYFTVKLQVQSANQSHGHKASEIFVRSWNAYKIPGKANGYQGFFRGFYNCADFCMGN